MRRLALPLLLALCSLAFAPAPLPKPRRQAQPAGPSWEGLWRRGRGPGGGTVRITATTFTNNPETARRPDFDVTTDRRASPATFDMRNHGAADLYLIGIYKVEGDVLTIHYNYANRAGRPTAFSGPGSGSGTETFTRVR
jgi:uncharacterized protein (TIGR03067 family)